MNSGIYKITNTVNDKHYIGSAVNFGKRFAHHKHMMRADRHHNAHLQAAWRKYGEGAFEFKKLLICAPKDLLFYEQWAIDGYKPEYNKCPIAGSPGLFRPCSPETKAKIAAANTGKKGTFTGRTHTAETRARMSAAKKGKKLSPEHCAKIGARTVGTTRSPELRAQIAAKLTGRKRGPLTPEHREKVAAANRGKKASPETKAKMSAALMGNQHTAGRRLSAEHKVAIGNKLRGRSMSMEQRVKLSLANMGNTSAKGAVRSPETRAKIGAAQAAHQQRKREARANGNP